MSLEVLLREDPVSAYWMGFILADGSLSDKRLRLRLAVKDKNHVSKFADLIGTSTLLEREGTTAGTSKQDPAIIPLIRERFDIYSQKTYNPPHRLPYNDSDLNRCAFIGFVDGDGSIAHQSGRTVVSLRTVSHISWLELKQAWSQDIQFGIAGTRLSNDILYSQITCYRMKDIKNLKSFGESRNLPLIQRKWDRVDAAPESTYGNLKPLVGSAIARGLTCAETIQETGCGPAYYYKIKKGR